MLVTYCRPQGHDRPRDIFLMKLLCVSPQNTDKEVRCSKGRGGLVEPRQAVERSGPVRSRCDH